MKMSALFAGALLVCMALHAQTAAVQSSARPKPEMAQKSANAKSDLRTQREMAHLKKSGAKPTANIAKQPHEVKKLTPEEKKTIHPSATKQQSDKTKK